MAHKSFTARSRAYRVSIFICGDIKLAANVLQEIVDDVGLCVTLEPVNYIFTGGNEMGMRVGLINYARFPKERHLIFRQAKNIAMILKERLNQGSFTVQDDRDTLFYSTRKEDGCA